MAVMRNGWSTPVGGRGEHHGAPHRARFFCPPGEIFGKSGNGGQSGPESRGFTRRQGSAPRIFRFERNLGKVGREVKLFHRRFVRNCLAVSHFRRIEGLSLLQPLPFRCAQSRPPPIIRHPLRPSGLAWLREDSRSARRGASPPAAGCGHSFPPRCLAWRLPLCLPRIKSSRSAIR